MTELVIASQNKKKAKEIKRLLAGLRVKILTLADFPAAPKVKEDGKDFKENAVKKALAISRFTKRLTIADDSGLQVAALGEEPGVHSARFAGREQNDRKNIKKLLRLLRKTPASKRQAQFRCVVAIAREGKLLVTLEGRCRGKIGFLAKGRHGFGYDPVFIPAGYKKTFAEMGPAVKDRLSHRSAAIRKAKKSLSKLIKISF